MARKVLLETGYTFTPSTKTLIINRAINRENLILITNVTTNQVIYNFSDPSLTATSYTINATNYPNGASIDPLTNVVTGQKDTTTIVLSYNTALMSSTDKLQILIDEYAERFTPSETLLDPVSKMRVSEPQSLIDTDFEYSAQPLKWESLSLVESYPSFFSNGTTATALDLANIVGNNATPKSTITVTTNTAHGLSTGNVVSVQDTLNSFAEGVFLITVTNSTTFTYQAKGQVSGSIISTGYTTVTGGGIYPNASIPISNVTYSGTTITVTTTASHGLYPGAPILLDGTTGTNAPNGGWIVSNVSSPTTFQFIATSTPSGTIGFGSAVLYSKPEGYQQHRATNGGILITTGGNYTGAQQIRQTRRYFRYQSGKAIQFSTGAKFTPSFDIVSITASGTTVSVTTSQDHNLQAGSTIKVEGVVSGSGSADSALYNITTTVTSVTGTNSFTYTTTSTPSDLAPGGTNSWITAINWKGASVSLGLFDEQNGFFFEYDGQNLYACRRESTKQLYGTITVTQNSGTITGSGTSFRKQLIAGDKIVIKGATYKIAQISSDTSLIINPTYRGPSGSNIKYLKTQTYRIPQSQWNMDKMDGTGPSSYNLDISKMQMAYIDYTWYGAGFIRFGFRSVNGDIIYCHKMPNNNINILAYMRSGNLAARFQAYNFGPYSRLLAGATATRGSNLASGDTTLYVENAVGWPTSGYVMLNDGSNMEMIGYTGIGAYNSTVRGYPLTGLTRRTSYSQAGISPAGSFSSSAYTFSGTSSSVTFSPDSTVGGSGTTQVGVQYIYNDCAPTVSHWGVSVIMDGRYDNDKSIQFTAGMGKYLTIASGSTVRPVLAIRIAPSVDSGIGRNFGVRELINRMQLNLTQLSIYSQGQFLIQGILNPATLGGGSLTFPTDWQTVSVGSGSLAQVVYFDGTSSSGAAATATGTITGGDRIFGFYTDNAGGNNYSNSLFDLSNVRDLGTSVISGPGGSGSSTSPVGYPIGPDVLVITATNLGGASANLAARLAWTEAQA